MLGILFPFHRELVFGESLLVSANHGNLELRLEYRSHAKLEKYIPGSILWSRYGTSTVPHFLNLKQEHLISEPF